MGRRPKAPRVEPASTETGTDPPVEMTENKHHMENPGNISAKKKATKSMEVFVRRSGRLRNLSSQRPNNEMAVEEIDLVDDEPHGEELSNELKEPHIEELSTEPISRPGDLEEKIGFLFQSVKEFKSMLDQVTNLAFPTEPQFPELDYKSLYIDSQKKIDSLVDENHELAKKLEFARGKVEAYEQMKDAIGNLKEMMLFSNLSKVTEAVLNFSSQAGTAKCNLPAVGSPGSPAAVANNDNLPVVTSPTATNGDEPKASPEKNKRGRKKSRQ